MYHPFEKYIISKSRETFQDTVEPRYNKGPREWQNLFAIMRFHYIVYPGLFSNIFHHYLGKQNH